MATFNGVPYTFASFAPYAYATIWDQFWDNVLVELTNRAAALGAAVPAITNVWNADTADANPGSGAVRVNAATVATATQVYVSTADAAGADVSAVIGLFDDSTSTAKGLLRIGHRTDATKWALFTVTGAVTVAAGYCKVPVSYMAGPGGFSAADPVAVGFFRTGDTTRWLSGAGAPAAGLGNDGDQYLNTTNGDVYAKVAGAWGAPVGNIRGPAGLNGTNGANGADGLMAAATNAETATGTATDKAVTPAGAVATFLKLAGGTLTGWLQTYAGVDKDTLGLRIGEATSGFYRSAAGVLGFVVGGVEVFRTAASGVLTFMKPPRTSLVSLAAVGNTFTSDCDAGIDFDCGVISANSIIANPLNPPAAGSNTVHSLTIKWTQDGIGGRTMSFGANCINIGGTSANTAAGKTNFATGKVYPDGKFYYSIVKQAS